VVVKGERISSGLLLPLAEQCIMNYISR